MMILACPRCHTLLDDVDSMAKCCANDGLIFRQLGHDAAAIDMLGRA
jgi:uncharacterized protein YbaR (Trm112 family)